MHLQARADRTYPRFGGMRPNFDLERAWQTLRARIEAAGDPPARRRLSAELGGNLAGNLAARIDWLLAKSPAALVFSPEQWAADLERRRGLRCRQLPPPAEPLEFFGPRYRERAWNTPGGVVPPEPNAPRDRNRDRL